MKRSFQMRWRCVKEMLPRDAKSYSTFATRNSGRNSTWLPRKIKKFIFEYQRTDSIKNWTLLVVLDAYLKYCKTQPIKIYLNFIVNNNIQVFVIFNFNNWIISSLLKYYRIYQKLQHQKHRMIQLRIIRILMKRKKFQWSWKCRRVNRK